MQWRRRQGRWAAPGIWRGAVLALTLVPGCGARTGLLDGNAEAVQDDDGGAPPAPTCAVDEDCFYGDRCQIVRCVDGTCELGPRVQCEDADPCTADECVPETGLCQYVSSASDLDGDGHPGPLPGFAPGEPGSCGDDCDDTSAAAWPGNEEVCDGVDNDCNGVIDDGFRYDTLDNPVVRVAGLDHLQSGPGGLAWNGTAFGATYAAQQDHWSNYFHGLSPRGATVIPEQSITAVASDSFTGPLIWTGSLFATAWEDRRDNDYEIYFNRLDAEGNKLGPDLRLSYAEEFSLHPDLLWNGSEYLVVWDDEREGPFRTYGQRITAEGELIGPNVPLTDVEWGANGVHLAEGERNLGISFTMEELDGLHIGFRTVGPDLEELGPLVTLSSANMIGAVLVWSGDRYIAAWHQRDDVPGDSIWGAAIAPDGTILVPERRLTYGASFARSKNLLALGNRLVLVWAAAGADGEYELYTKMLSPELDELAPQVRITNAPGGTTAPVLSFGPEGEVGILFEDQRSGSWQVYYTWLTCITGSIG